MKTLIIDNYDSFTYNIYQFIGELGGNPMVVRNDQIRLDEITKRRFSHIVISPGPGSPDDREYFGVCMEVIGKLGQRVPLLGVCLGHQGIVSAFGGKVIRAGTIKHGKQSMVRHNGQNIFKNLKNPLIGMRYHSLMGEKETLPGVLEVIAESLDDQTVMGVRHREYPIFGVQFHPESIGTHDGKRILMNFLNY